MKRVIKCYTKLSEYPLSNCTYDDLESMDKIRAKKENLSYRDMQSYIHFWAGQVGNYNSGCMCHWCSTQIFNNLKWVMDKWLTEQKKYESKFKKP